MKNAKEDKFTDLKVEIGKALQNSRRSISIALFFGIGLLIVSYAAPTDLFVRLEMKPEAAAGFALLFSSISNYIHFEKAFRLYHKSLSEKT